MKKKYLKLFEYVANAEIRFNKNVCRAEREVQCATIIKQGIVNIRWRKERARTFKVVYRKFLTIDKPLSVDKLYNL